MVEGIAGVRNEVKIRKRRWGVAVDRLEPAAGLTLYPNGVKSRGDRDDEFVFLAEAGCPVEHSRQICDDFFCPASRKKRDPLFVWVEAVLLRIGFAGDCRKWQLGQGMAYELGIDSTGAVERLFERKDDHHAADPLLHPTEALSLPCPELRADEVDDGDVEFFELAGEAEVDVGEVDQDGYVRTALFDGSDELAILAVDEGGVPDDLGDAHVGNVFGAHNAVLAGVGHFLAAEAEELGVRRAGAEFGNDLGTVVIATGLAGGEEDSRIGCRYDGISVDFSRGNCMAEVAAKRFRAVLECLGGELGWTVARVPFDVKTTWKKMVRLRVKVDVTGEVFRTSLFVDSAHGGYFVLVNKRMQKAAGVKLGGMIDLAIEPDLEEREAWVPAELERLLKEEKALAKWYAKLSEPRRREIGKYIDGVKGAEARQRRAEQITERLILTMESEKALPPILEVAFGRNPKARKGWEAMTLIQRRGHLMGVFYYQSPEARQKRVGKLIEDCLRVACS